MLPNHFLRVFCLIATALSLATPVCAEDLRLLYTHRGETWEVRGIHDGMPFAFENGERRHLPAGGVLSLEGFEPRHLGKARILLGFQLIRGPSGRPHDAGAHSRYRLVPVQKGIRLSSADAADKPWMDAAAHPNAIGVVGWYADGVLSRLAIRSAYQPTRERGFLYPEVDDLSRDEAGGVPLLLMLADGALLSIWDPMSPLEQALLVNDPGTIAARIKAGEDPNKPERNGWAPVHLASILGNAAARELLHHHTANLEMPDGYDWRPLHHAAANGSSAVQWLVDAGVNLEKFARDEGSGRASQTALFMAIEGGHLEAFDRLMDAGAPVRARRARMPALQLAVHHRRDDMIQRLADSGQRLRIDSARRDRVLTDLIREDRVRLVRYLIEREGFRVDRRLSGIWPVHLAVHWSSAEMLELLEAHGADIQQHTDQGGSLLHLGAAQNPHVIPWLIKRGFSPNQEDERGVTPLRVAVSSRCLECAAILLELGADPNAEPDERSPLLWVATRLAQRESVRRLIDAGAVCDFDVRTALDVMEDAFRYDIPEIFDVALTQCLDVDFAFTGGFSGWWVAERHGAEGVQSLMLERGLVPDRLEPVTTVAPSQIGGAPAIISHPLPEYPREISSQYGTQRIRIDVVIDADGRVRFPIFLENPVEAMKLPLLASLRSWRFEPPILPEGIQGLSVVIPIVLREESKVFEVQDLHHPPVPVRQFAPEIPPEFRPRTVVQSVLIFIIDETGRVMPDSVRVEHTTDASIDMYLIEAIRKWRWEPGTDGGEPVKVRVRQPMITRP